MMAGDFKDLERKVSETTKRIRSTYAHNFPINQSDLDFLSADMDFLTAIILYDVIDPKRPPIVVNDRQPK
jgi:hypothetical protein